jgi:hypothetical protein
VAVAEEDGKRLMGPQCGYGQEDVQSNRTGEPDLDSVTEPRAQKCSAVMAWAFSSDKSGGRR